jgi:class 3 adenylate cyclase
VCTRITISTTIDGEREMVTARFAGIRGSTELMEDLDPEGKMVSCGYR